MFLLHLTSDYNHLVVGDFNMPDIDWNTMSAPSTCSEMFCEAIFNRNFCHIISEPTHAHQGEHPRPGSLRYS